MVKTYPAGEVAEFVADGMDPDCEVVLASDYAALEAELARVRAESLRVVDDPSGDEWVMTPDGLGWYGQDAIGNPCLETPHGYFHDYDQCKAVRLERWETEA